MRYWAYTIILVTVSLRAGTIYQPITGWSPAPSGESIAVITQAANTGTGTQDYTSSGFGTPVGAMFVLTQATTDATAVGDAAMSVGFTDGTNRFVASAFSEDNVATTDTYRVIDNTDEVFKLIDATGSIDCEADFDSWITDGVRVNWGNGCAAGYLATVTLFGNSFTDAVVGEATVPCSGDDGATQDETVGSFRPHIVLTASTGGGTSVSSIAQLSVGVAESDHAGTEVITNRVVTYTSEDNSSTSGVNTHFEENLISANLSAASNGYSRAGELTATSTTGGGDFTITCRQSNHNIDYTFGYLALDLTGSYFLGTFTSASGVNDLSSAGFEPDGLLMGHSLNTTTGILRGVGSGGIAVSSAANAAQSCSVSDDNGITTSNTQSICNDVAVHVANDDGSDQTICTHTFDSLGVNLDCSDIISTGGHKSWYLLVN